MHRLIALGALAAAFVLPLAAPAPAMAQTAESPGFADMSDAEREAFRSEVRAYLLDNPEVILEAINILEERRNAEAQSKDSDLVARHAEELFESEHSWVGGNPDGDVTVVEFSDYRCGFCKRAHPIVKDLVESDGNVRLVIKEFPILGPDSVMAGRMAQAALEVDPSLYGELNDRLMAHRGELGETQAYRIAKEVGYDVAELKERAASDEIEAQLRETYALAESLGLQGTPSFVIGDQIVRGFVELDAMQAAVARARTAD